MPHSERTFKPKIRSPGAVFEIWLMSTDFKEIVQYLQNYKYHEVNQGHSKKL